MTIPLQHISLYYDLELLRNVFIRNIGLLLKIKIPMSSQIPIHKVFEGVPLPQPIANSTTASVLVLKHDLLVVSEATTNFAETQILSFQGLKRLKLCEQPFSITTGWMSEQSIFRSRSTYNAYRKLLFLFKIPYNLSNYKILDH